MFKDNIKTYHVAYKYSNNIQLIDVIMELFSHTVLEQELSSREKCVLREYLTSGYSLATKRAIRTNMNIKDTNLNTINHTLQKKGFLKPHPTNQRLKLINEELARLKECFLNHSGQKVFLIEFKKDV